MHIKNSQDECPFVKSVSISPFSSGARREYLWLCTFPTFLLFMCSLCQPTPSVLCGQKWSYLHTGLDCSMRTHSPGEGRASLLAFKWIGNRCSFPGWHYTHLQFTKGQAVDSSWCVYWEKAVCIEPSGLCCWFTGPAADGVLFIFKEWLSLCF